MLPAGGKGTIQRTGRAGNEAALSAAPACHAGINASTVTTSRMGVGTAASK